MCRKIESNIHYRKEEKKEKKLGKILICHNFKALKNVRRKSSEKENEK